MSIPKLSSRTRLMVIAPHPDDESLACGILLQRAMRAGAAIRVIYATDGDNNPWPQRALQRKWRLGRRERERWGRLRRMEARAALRVLGLPRGHAHFLGLPDQGLLELTNRRGPATRNLFREAIVSWRPTLLLVPSLADTHGDHRALGILLRGLQTELTDAIGSLVICSFQVHGRRAARGAVFLEQTPDETAKKVAAISCHKTQLALSRGRFLRYAIRPERFVKLNQTESTAPLTARSLKRRALRLPFPLRPAGIGL